MRIRLCVAPGFDEECLPNHGSRIGVRSELVVLPFCEIFLDDALELAVAQNGSRQFSAHECDDGCDVGVGKALVQDLGPDCAGCAHEKEFHFE